MRAEGERSQGFAGDHYGKRRKGDEEASPPLLHIEAQFAKLACVLARALVVGEDCDPAGPEYAGDVVEGGQAYGTLIEIMETEIGDHDVKGGVGKGHLGGGLADERATLGDSFELEIVLRGRLSVSGEIVGGPDIDAGGMAGAEMLCGACQQKTTAASDVKHLLVTSPRVEREHVVAMTKFPDLDVEEIEASLGKKKESGPAKHRASKKLNSSDVNRKGDKDAQQKAEDAEEEEIAKHRGSVDAVVGPFY